MFNEVLMYNNSLASYGVQGQIKSLAEKELKPFLIIKTKKSVEIMKIRGKFIFKKEKKQSFIELSLKTNLYRKENLQPNSRFFKKRSLIFKINNCPPPASKTLSRLTIN
jgi:hypothetical protein